MAKRKGISTKTRFEVFKRDEFTCQYCGSHPPDAILHVDHIVAVANGGGDEMDNLVTACDLCNMGKGARWLSAAPQTLKDKSELVRKREEQLRGYQQILAAKRVRLESETWKVGRELSVVTDDKMDRSYFQSIKKFIERLGFDEVLEAAEIAMAKKIWNEHYRFKYFCGVCWGKIKDIEGK